MIPVKSNHPVWLDEPFEVEPSHGADFFWLTNDTIAYRNASSLWTMELSSGNKNNVQHLFDFPEGISASGLQYNHESGVLAFNAQVWADGDLSKAAEQNEKYAERGTTGVVFDELFIR